MKEDGLIGLEDGKPYFHKMVDGKPVATNIDDSIQVYLNENKHLAAGSNVAGPGRTHSNTASTSNNGLLTPQQLRDALSKI